MTIYHQNNNISNLNIETESFCNIGYPKLCIFCLNSNCFLRLTYFYEYVNTLNEIWREIQYVSVTLVMPRFESSLISHDYKPVEEACFLNAITNSALNGDDHSIYRQSCIIYTFQRGLNYLFYEILFTTV